MDHQPATSQDGDAHPQRTHPRTTPSPQTEPPQTQPQPQLPINQPGQPPQQIQTESIWSKMTEEELNRYEMFRRSTFPKASIKRLMQTMTGAPMSQNVVIAMSGMAKVFVGELVEEAIRIQARYGESGPIEPKHLREAHRVIKHRHDKTVKIF